MRRKNKKKAVLFMTMLLLLESPFLSSLQAHAAVESGAYRQVTVASADDLLRLRESCTLDTWSQNTEVVLTDDIELGGADFTPIPTFGGTFNGSGHTLRGLLIEGKGSARGLFRYIQPSGVVKDLKVEGVVLSDGSSQNIGGIAGVNYGRIENCGFSGTVIGQTQTGGIAGLNESGGMILSDRTDGDVTGEHFTGGIVGKNLGTVSSCTNNCKVNTNNPEIKMNLENLNIEHLNSTENLSSHTDTGGICGYSSGVIAGCFSLGTIGYPHTGYNVGGIAGRQNGYITGCSNQAEVYGRKDVSGIVGQAEPYLIMEFSRDTMQQLDTEVGKMHDLINTAAGHFTGSTSLFSVQLDALTEHFRTAGDSIHTVMNSLVEFTDGTMDAVNDTSTRIGDLTGGTDRTLAELGSAADSLQQATDQMQSSFDRLKEEKEVSGALTEKVRQILALFLTDTGTLNTSVSDTAALVSDLSAARSDLGSRAEALSDTVSGNTLPPELKAELLSDIDSANRALSDFDSASGSLQQKAAAAVSSISSYTTARSAALAPPGSALTASTLRTAAEELSQSNAHAQEAGRQTGELKAQLEPSVNALSRASDLLNGAYEKLPAGASASPALAQAAAPSLSDLLNTLQKLEDALSGSSAVTAEVVKILKEMIPYFDQAGAIAADALDYMKKAFAGMSGGFSSVGDAIDIMHGTMSGLAARPNVTFPRWNSAGSAAIDTLFTSVSSAADTVHLLNDTMKKLGDTAADDIRAINDQLNVIFHLLIDAQDTDSTENIEGLIEDVSDSEEYDHTEGKIANCVNNGAVEGDIDVGGIVGMMAQEYDFDPEDDINSIGQKSMSFKYKTRAVAASCINRGDLVSKKDQIGGIVGRMDLGSVVDCQNYGPAKSESGSYIGGIAGYSSSVIKNCYSLCGLSGGDYIGGIAGAGFDILNCRSLVSIDSSGEALGAIAGFADGEISENYFVENEFAGIDGISYDRMALPQTYEAFIESPSLPAEFRIFKLRFVADGKTVANIPIEYGSSLSEEKIPEIPPKEGCYASWPAFDYDNIRGSAVLNAEYTPWVTVISSDTVRADSGLPVFLAQGEFTPDAVMDVLAQDGGGSPGDEMWRVKITGMKAPGAAVTLRCLVPDGEREYGVLIQKEGQWRKTACTKDGSYLVFPADAVTEVALVAKPDSKVTVLIVFLLSAGAVCLLLFVSLRKKKVRNGHKGLNRRTSRNKRRIAEESPHSPDSV